MINAIKAAVLDAAQLMLEANEVKKTEVKTSIHDLVTEYDKRIQEQLYRQLSKAFPGAGFLGEEGLVLSSSGKGTFIIDPIDGTTNFVKGLNHSAVSVGYCENGIMMLGVIYDPYKKELFTAEKDRGTFLNGKRIHVSDRPLEHSLAYYGTSPYVPELTDKSFRLAAELTKKVIDSRRLGAATLDFCDIACGRAELFVEYSLCPWDLAAGSLIASEAGAVITDMEGKPLQFEKKTSCIAANPACYEEVLKIVRSMDSLF